MSDARSKDAGTGDAELKAGRELDALVAEKVMGFEVFHPPQSSPGYLAIMSVELGAVPLPRYSTDISAAWTVVEKMREIGSGWNLQLNTGAFCIAKFWLQQTIPISVQSAGPMAPIGESAPVAICLAALKAVELHRRYLSQPTEQAAVVSPRPPEEKGK